MSSRDPQAVQEIEKRFRGLWTDMSEEQIQRNLEFELNSVEIHRENLVPFVRGHGASTGDRVLDFGSGPGCSATAMAVDLGVTVVGVEPNVSVEDVAPLWAKCYGVQDRVSFHFTDDTLHLPFEDASFDYVLTSSVLEYIPGNRAPYLREMWRTLKPGGRLMVAGTANAALPVEPHSKTWLINWMPNLGPKIRELRGQNPNVERGITFGEIQSSLPGARFVRGRDELEAFAQRFGAKADRLPELIKKGIEGAVHGSLRAIDERTSKAVDWPAEAFLPWLNVAFEKTR